MDEQAAHDLPMAVAHIPTNSEPTELGRVSVVGHSMGATLTLLALSYGRQFSARGPGREYLTKRQ